MSRRTIKRGPGKRLIEGKDFQLADEIRYIQGRAAEHDGRWVTVGPLALFSTETGDAWLLDAEDHLAVDGQAADQAIRSERLAGSDQLGEVGRAASGHQLVSLHSGHHFTL